MNRQKHKSTFYLVLTFLIKATVLTNPLSSQAQNLDELPPLVRGEVGTRDELIAWEMLITNRPVGARSKAEQILKQNRDSIIAHIVLGSVQHFTEVNLPKALYHYKKALFLFEKQHGDPPNPNAPLNWHMRTLRLLGTVQNELEDFEASLQTMDKHDSLYEPKILHAARAWPLMKLRRFEEARQTAREALQKNNLNETQTALNALCAIEFETNHHQQSYQACKQALDFGKSIDAPEPVDFTNLAEASRAFFNLEEAEKLLLRATEIPTAGFSNPWLELADLYLRQARFAEAMSALKKVSPYKQMRPVQYQNIDANEVRRTLTNFLILTGYAEEATKITQKALSLPDRRSHTSRDPGQDRILTFLLDRQAKRLLAQILAENKSTLPFYKRIFEQGTVQKVESESWASGQRATKLLLEKNRLVGILRIGESNSSVTPPWLIYDLSQLVGTKVWKAAISQAQMADNRDKSEFYYQAYLLLTDFFEEQFEKIAQEGPRLLIQLPQTENILKTHLMAAIAKSSFETQGWKVAQPWFEKTLQKDPGIFRRMRIAIPAFLTSQNRNDQAGEIEDAIERSPRFEIGDMGLEISIRASSSTAKICAFGTMKSQLFCANQNTDDEQWLPNLVEKFHQQGFSPRVQMSQSDIQSLDGSNQIVRNPLKTLLGTP